MANKRILISSSSSSSSSPLDNLFNNAIYSIINWLSFKDRVKFFSCGKRYKRLTCDQAAGPLRDKDIKLNAVVDPNLKCKARMIKRFGGAEYLKMEYKDKSQSVRERYNYLTLTENENVLSRVIFNSSRYLRSLSVDMMCIYGDILNGLSNSLEHFEIYNVNNYAPPSSILLDRFQTLSKLSSLSILNNERFHIYTGDDCDVQLTSLRKLEISATGINLTEIKLLLNATPALQFLKLKTPSYFPLGEINELKELKEIEIISTGDEMFGGARFIFEDLLKLKYAVITKLTIHDHIGLLEHTERYQSFFHTLWNLKSLTHVALGCSITDEPCWSIAIHSEWIEKHLKLLKDGIIINEVQLYQNRNSFSGMIGAMATLSQLALCDIIRWDYRNDMDFDDRHNTPLDLLFEDDNGRTFISHIRFCSYETFEFKYVNGETKKNEIDAKTVWTSMKQYRVKNVCNCNYKHYMCQQLLQLSMEESTSSSSTLSTTPQLGLLSSSSSTCSLTTP